MPHIIDRLAALRVSDVMAREVVSVGKSQTMSEVAAIFSEQKLSSAPVVDELGHCVGVITASDFVRRQSELQQMPEEGFAADAQLQTDEKGKTYRCVPLGDDFVSYHMTEAVQAIDPGASLLKAARMMCTQHIHRLLVIDDRSQPVGVVSTMDIVAAAVNVVDEMNQDSQRNGP